VGERCVAVVNANFTDSADQIKRNVRYIQHRTGRDGERITRTLFGVDGSLTREEVYKLIDEAPPGALFYRLKISPDPQREDSQKDLDLRQVTDDILFALSKKLGYHVEYAGAVHDDHTSIRHVHVVAVVWKKLDRSHLQVLRESATEAALSQRQERDRARAATRGIDRAPAVTRQHWTVLRKRVPVTFPKSERRQVGAAPQGSVTDRTTRPGRLSLRRQRRSWRWGRRAQRKKPKRCRICGLENCLVHEHELELEREL
jgi:hypothetical protein